MRAKGHELKQAIWTCALATALLLGGCGSRVIVTDATTGRPIAGAHVELNWSAGPALGGEVHTTVAPDTNAGGVTWTGAGPAGMGFLVNAAARKQGYRPGGEYGHVQTGDGGPTPRQEIRIRLQPEGSQP
ncbi:MAG: hypothetical protein BIFFINMI_01779 [Phycisphaerae bacterium]|nr:hypothetical protein [Phycisphaerae bacterium]